MRTCSLSDLATGPRTTYHRSGSNSECDSVEYKGSTEKSVQCSMSNNENTEHWLSSNAAGALSSSQLRLLCLTVLSHWDQVP
jgi:hypothetical protein